jgi:hypothetical protein
MYDILLPELRQVRNSAKKIKKGMLHLSYALSPPSDSVIEKFNPYKVYGSY